MDHIKLLADSAVIFTPMESIKNRIVTSKHGVYWANIGSVLTGANDIRPRLGTFTNPFNAKSDSLFAPPPIREITDSFGDLMDKRACEILEYSQKTNNKILLSWSGGIDSTAVLVAFLRNCSDTSNLIVYLSPNSIIENPDFYEKFISGRLECKHPSTMNISANLLNNNIVINGDPADSIFGPSSGMFSDLIKDNRHTISWKDNVNAIKDRITLKSGNVKGFSDWYVDKVCANIEEVGTYEINSIADWWWWNYFNLKWSTSVYRPFFRSRESYDESIPRELVEKYVSLTFFNTDYFQNWSYTNLQDLYTPGKHKIVARTYIHDFDKNDNYFNHKKKSFSTFSISGIWHPIYLDSELRGYSVGNAEATDAVIELLGKYTG
jgi:hypothetical protein